MSESGGRTETRRAAARSGSGSEDPRTQRAGVAARSGGGSEDPRTQQAPGPRGVSESGGRWMFRALAVVIAVGIWLPASFCPRLREMTTPPSETNVVARLTVPDHERLTVLSFEPEGVQVRIRGADELIASLDLDQVRVQVPVPEDALAGGPYSGPREVEVVLAAEDVVLPAEEVEVVSVTPDRLVLSVDEEISVAVPVQVAWIGEPIGGISVDDENVRIEPPMVTVQGARSEINKLGVALAGPIDLTGRGLDFTDRQVRVRFASEHVRVESPTIVDVFVPMVSRQPQTGAPRLPPVRVDGDAEDRASPGSGR